MQFRCAHTSHPDWRFATEMVLTELERQRLAGTHSPEASLGIVYLTEALGEHVHEIVHLLKTRTGLKDWIGTIGQGVLASGVEYIEKPAMAVLLPDLPPHSASVFSGLLRPPARNARAANGAWLADHAIVHACSTAPDLPDLVQDMAGKLHSGNLIGGLTSSRKRAWQIANDVIEGGMSGVVLSSQVRLLTRVTQGCQPVGPAHDITEHDGHLIYLLDGTPALDVLLADLGAPPGGLIAEQYMQRISQGLFAALAEEGADTAVDYQVRNLVALDPDKRSIAIAHHVHNKQQLLFCTRDAAAARNDLIRICTEIRELLETTPIRGALYYSCISRSDFLFGGHTTEMEIIQQELGDIPLIGLFASGEIAGNRLYGHSGVLSVFY
ncbi:MAG: histidine kinase [Burkholderiaceae bacterium]|nr:MAG: histidine kinase [Burkholderiaceae bacterium]